MLFLTVAALGSDSGVQRLYDRQITCGHGVDPPAEAASCTVVVRRDTPDDQRPTWAFGIAPPGRLFLGFHMPAIDWGHVYRIDVKRSFDPVLVSVGLTEDQEACPNERLMYTHVISERGPLTHQVCAQIDGEWESEVLLEGHRKLPSDQWVPLWAQRKADDSDVKNWFIVQAFIATQGQIPDRPPQHPYVSESLLRASIPAPLPPRRPVLLDLPDEEPVEGEAPGAPGAEDTDPPSDGG